MKFTRRTLVWALLLVLVAPLAAQARVADQAGLFSQDTLRQLDQADQQMQQTCGRGLLVVTVNDLNGRRWEDVAKQYPTSSDKGVYVFLVKNQKMLRVMQPKGAGIPTSRLDDIRNAILGGIRGGGFDKGIIAGLPVIEDTYRSMGWTSAPGGAPQQRERRSGGINWMFILIVGVGVFFLFKMIGATRNRGGYQAPGYGQPGYGQPGYGQPGYGAPSGGGGGFMSGLLGGLGGAVAGNWLYDQFRGHGSGGGYSGGQDVGGSYTQSDNTTGGDYDYGGASGGSWQDSGGAEADFSGSAGGDWGGGGGDFGGGGGGDW